MRRALLLLSTVFIACGPVDADDPAQAPAPAVVHEVDRLLLGPCTIRHAIAEKSIRYEYVLNGAGQPTEIWRYEQGGTHSREVETREYDANGHLVSICDHRWEESDCEAYVVTADGRRTAGSIQIVHIGPLHDGVIVYDEEGRRIEEKRFSHDSPERLVSLRKWIWQEGGVRIEDWNVGDERSEPSVARITEERHDPDGLVIERLFDWSADGEFDDREWLERVEGRLVKRTHREGVERFEYDDFGNLLRRVEATPDGLERDVYTYDYACFTDPDLAPGSWVLDTLDGWRI